jgi:hypothetical protein
MNANLWKFTEEMRAWQKKKKDEGQPRSDGGLFRKDGGPSGE